MITIDMKMPKDGRPHKALVVFYPDGTAKAVVEYSKSYDDRHIETIQVVELPPHGDLIDRDALAADLKRQCKEVFKIDAVSPDDFWITRNEAYNESLWKTWCESFFEYLKTRETIIPAEEETCTKN